MKGIKMAMISQNKFLNGVFIAMNDLNLLTTTISTPSKEIVDLVASLGIHFAGIDLSSKGHQLAFIDEKNKVRGRYYHQSPKMSSYLAIFEA